MQVLKQVVLSVSIRLIRVIRVLFLFAGLKGLPKAGIAALSYATKRPNVHGQARGRKT